MHFSIRKPLVVLAPALLAFACGPTNVVKRFRDSASTDDASAGDASTLDGGDYVSRASDPACDMGGIWIARQTNFASAVGMATIGANWYYFELEQEGDLVRVAEHFDCGLAVRASVSVTISEKTLTVLAEHNLQAGRSGTMKRNGDACDFTLQRFWNVRGASDAAYLPRGRFDTRDIPEVALEAPLPSAMDPSGQEDWDDDENPGVTLLIGAVGERYSVMRDWIQWFSCNGNESDSAACKPENAGTYGITPTLMWDQFTVRADINNEESVIAASSPLWGIGGVADRTKNNRVTFLHLGRTRTAPLAQEFWDQGDVVARCTWLQQRLPSEEGSE